MGAAEYCVDVVLFEGHGNVRAAHPTTLEVTKDEHLTPRGDCIIGVRSNKGASDLSQCVKDVLRSGGALVAVVLTDSGHFDYLVAEGSEKLTFEDPRKIIVRRSTYADGSTVGIRSSKAARDVSRAVVEALRRGEKGALVLVALRRPPEPSTPPRLPSGLR